MASDATTANNTLLERTDISIFKRRTPYAVSDKLQELTWLNCDAHGRRKLKVNPWCKDLFHDLKFVLLKEGSVQPDKSDPEHPNHCEELVNRVLGALKPLMPKRHQIRNRSIAYW